jgi:threonine dehydrogenase-like Zn-dependent dehydrogenase
VENVESMMMMKVLLWDGSAYPEDLSWADIPKPKVQPDWVVVENQAVGIYGYDLHCLSGAMRHQIPEGNYPAVLGHENMEIVVEIGESVQGWPVRDRIAGEPLHSCMLQGLKPCDACRMGQYHFYENMDHIGNPARLQHPGGFDEFSTYHQRALFRIRDTLSFEEAVLLYVLACGVHVVHIGSPTSDTMAGIGCGAIGLELIQCLWAVACNLVTELAICLEDVADHVAEILQIIGEVDQVYECVGRHGDTMQQAIDLCHPGGHMLMPEFFSDVRPP